MGVFKSRFQEKLKKSYEESKTPNSSQGSDERFWAEDFKEKGKYELRFVCDKNDLMTVSYKTHKVKYTLLGREKVYDHICPKSVGLGECPTCEKQREVYKTENDVEIDKMKTWIKSKNIRIANARILSDEKLPDIVGKIKLVKINGVIWKLFVKQIESEPDKKKPLAGVNPFDPVCGLTLQYEYIPPVNGKGFPNWDNSEFLPQIVNLKGEPVDLDKITDEMQDKISEFVAKNTTDLTAYMEEIKEQTPTEDEILKNIGSILFGNFEPKTTQKTTNKEILVGKEVEETDDDEVEDEEETKPVAKKATVSMEDDDMPF
jgi:hypothetical protein